MAKKIPELSEEALKSLNDWERRIYFLIKSSENQTKKGENTDQKNNKK